MFEADHRSCHRARRGEEREGVHVLTMIDDSKLVKVTALCELMEALVANSHESGFMSRKHVNERCHNTSYWSRSADPLYGQTKEVTTHRLIWLPTSRQNVFAAQVTTSKQKVSLKATVVACCPFMLWSTTDRASVNEYQSCCCYLQLICSLKVHVSMDFKWRCRPLHW